MNYLFKVLHAMFAGGFHALLLITIPVAWQVSFQIKKKKKISIILYCKCPFFSTLCQHKSCTFLLSVLVPKPMPVAIPVLV